MSKHVRKPALPALSGIRTPLAICIIFFHFTPPHLQLLYPIINTGFVFVGFFFLISGFILTYNYADRAHTISKRDFWVARASRLYPVYLFSLALYWSFVGPEWHYHTHSDFWMGMVLTPLLLQGWFPWLATFWNTVAWTLSCEAMMYVAFPWINRIRWPRTMGKLIGLGLAIWVIGLIPHTLYIFLNPDHLSAPADRYTSAVWIRMLKYTPLPYLATFLVGMILGQIHPLIGDSNGKEDNRKRFWLAAIGCALALWFLYGFATRVPYILEHGGVMTPIFGLIILGIAGKHSISAVFGWRPLVVLGDATYCLYLLHFDAYILIHLHHWPEKLHVAALDPWISYVAVIVLALAANRWIEMPGKNLVLKLFKEGKAGEQMAKPEALTNLSSN